MFVVSLLYSMSTRSGTKPSSMSAMLGTRQDELIRILLIIGTRERLDSLTFM